VSNLESSLRSKINLSKEERESRMHSSITDADDLTPAKGIISKKYGLTQMP